MVWPAIIAAAATLGSSALGNAAQRKATHAQQDIAEQNIALQKEFAQTGIRWRVQDAIAAGIHPLAALGANTTSFAPVSIMSEPQDAWAKGLSQMGQNISEAWARQATADERSVAAYKMEQERLKMENLHLQNQGLRRELNTLNTTPALPSNLGVGQVAYDVQGNAVIPGQGDISYITEPAMRTRQQSAGVSAGSTAASDWYDYPDYGRGRIRAPMTNERLAESIESGGFVDRWKHNYLTGRELLKNWYHGYDQGDAEGTAAWREALRERRPQDAREGMIWLWDRFGQYWVEVPSYEGDTRLFNFEGNDPGSGGQRYSIFGNR